MGQRIDVNTSAIKITNMIQLKDLIKKDTADQNKDIESEQQSKKKPTALDIERKNAQTLRVSNGKNRGSFNSRGNNASSKPVRRSERKSIPPEMRLENSSQRRLSKCSLFLISNNGLTKCVNFPLTLQFFSTTI